MTASRARDPGLQPERTALAWRRTMLTATGVTLLCAHAWLEQRASWMLLTTVLALLTICTTGLGLILRRRSCHVHACHIRTLETYVPALTSGTIAAAGVASVAMFIGC